MNRKLTIILAIAGLTISGFAFAQAWVSAAPLYGVHTLNTGFTPDPQPVSVTAGGSEAATVLGAPAECLGSIVSAQPDVRLNYTAGTTFPLRFYVVSAIDTTLVINAPDMSWHCNDDGIIPGAGLNPVVDLTGPASGQYDIWIGTWAGGTGPATLYITELLSNGPASH